MSEQNITRRDAVKMGGGALAAVGLSTAASTTTPAAPGVGSGRGLPGLPGKTLLLYTNRANTTQLLTDPVLLMQAGRLFLTGRTPEMGWWTDGLSAAVAWDAVDTYFVFYTGEQCEARWKNRSGHRDSKSEAAASRDQPSS